MVEEKRLRYAQIGQRWRLQQFRQAGAFNSLLPFAFRHTGITRRDDTKPLIDGYGTHPAPFQ